MPRKKPLPIENAYQTLNLSPEAYIREASFADPVIFAEANLMSERGTALEYHKQHDFLKQYLRDFSERMCVIKSSQVGITTTSMVKVLYLAHLNDQDIWKKHINNKSMNGVRVIYTFPTEKDVQDFSATRFGTMVRSSPLLIEMMGGRRGVNAILRKIIGNSAILFRGTTKESQAISQPADLIVNDELDFSNQEVVDAFDSRLTHSDLKWWWKFSTPTIPNFGIDAEYTMSNQYNWLVKCRFCNKSQMVKYPGSIKKRRVKGNWQRYWGCSKCGKELDRTLGSWVPKFSRRKYVGYRIPPMICPWISPDDLRRSKQIYRTEKLFHNYALGEAFASGADMLTRDLLLKRIEFGDPYNADLDKLIYMGVDQGDVLHYEIARGRNRRREVLAVGTTTTFDVIAMLMRKWAVSICVMDALPNKKTAQQFADDFYGRVYLAFYKDFDEDADVKPTRNMEMGVTLDRTNTLDMAAESWRKGESVFCLDRMRYSRVPNEIDNPQNKRAWVQQMAAMVRDEELNEKTGKARHVWVKTGEDHFRHADNYCHAAWLQHQTYDEGRIMTVPSIINLDTVGGIPDIAGIRSGFKSDF